MCIRDRYIGVIAQLVEQRTEDPCALVRFQVAPLIFNHKNDNYVKSITPLIFRDTAWIGGIDVGFGCFLMLFFHHNIYIG